MKRIGITGPTGAGKSTALHVLKTLGVQVVDCDVVYHDLLQRDITLRTELLERFGPDILDQANQIDRKKLGAIVYRNTAALVDLNNIAHAHVLEALAHMEETALREGRPAVAYDAIALIESGLGARCNAVVGVLAPLEVRIRRIMARDGISEAYARMRVSAQKEDGFFRAHCTYILENDDTGTPQAFQAEAERLFTRILKL